MAGLGCGKAGKEQGVFRPASNDFLRLVVVCRYAEDLRRVGNDRQVADRIQGKIGPQRFFRSKAVEIRGDIACQIDKAASSGKVGDTAIDDAAIARMAIVQEAQVTHGSTPRISKLG
ncbi:hypothetical protein [Sinorhizobium fredii]|uniref:hypothetical protein n=1 Tax=Rhizobium fredii TaxID=380 RepID=UPI003515CD4E